MNYKIKTTEENQAIVKRIANENEMNPNLFDFNPDYIRYEIMEGKFVYLGTISNSEFRILTTEKFIKMFDKQQTELEVWLSETKAKNLSLRKLEYYLVSSACPANVWDEIDGDGSAEKAQLLFDQWNAKQQSEWKPKRGERVLVWDDNESDAVERIFLTILDIMNLDHLACVVAKSSEFQYINGDRFALQRYKHMKQLPIIEAIVETDFKTKVVELIENEIEAFKENSLELISSREFINAGIALRHEHYLTVMLKIIKEL